MPSRLRTSGAAGDATQKAPHYDIPGLHFDDSLTWRAGKAIAVTDLLTRLQTLSGCLRAFDQDQVDSRAFKSLAHDLANANLLGHKDKGVRAWTVSCIVDVLKICAPDAPLSIPQIKDVFTVVINSILPALADPNNAYNSQHVYVLASLAESQSILLVIDVPNHDSLIVALFTTAFDIVSGSAGATAGFEVSKSVEYHLKNLLACVVDEIALPQEVTDVIISQFMRVDGPAASDEGPRGKKRGAGAAQDKNQATLSLKDYPPAYTMAKSLCTTCPEKMTAQITQYFGAVIVGATMAQSAKGFAKPSRRRASDVADSDDEQDGLIDLRKAHRLLRELWRACPDVLLNVVPQIEAELHADYPFLRQIATETLGAIAAGIGIAGLPPAAPLDPASYPLPSIDQPEPAGPTLNPLLTPASPKPFSHVHAAAYNAFLGRRNDQSPAVREGWATSAAQVLRTSAGGIGLNEGELHDLLQGFAQCLRDPEEHVRFAAVQAIRAFPYQAIIRTLCADGGLSRPDTVLSTLVDRVIDRKQHVRNEAIDILARIWGVASKDIEDNVELVKAAVGEIPNHLFHAFYTNDPHVHASLDRALYESLLPLSFPPVKAATSRTESQKPRAEDPEGNSQESLTADPDNIRARRILTLVHSLNPAKARPVFFSLQNRQVQLGKALTVFLQACEEFNGGVVEDELSEAKIKDRLKRFIDTIAKPFPNSAEVAANLWKFAKHHNRRWYQLIRFATGPEYDYRTVTKAIRELLKRIHEGPANLQSLGETLQPVLYRCALLAYNRSHVPTIMDISRTDEGGMGEVAHEVLKEISARNPEVLKSHIQALCKELEMTAPSASKPEEAGAADTLKACAGFARRYPADVPKDRKFLTALTQFASFAKSPRAAKHAVSIVMLVADKEMYARDMLSRALKGCQPPSPHGLSHLATISQLCLLAPAMVEREEGAITQVTVQKTLLCNRSPDSTDDATAWTDVQDDETTAKELALKILVNRCRGLDETSHGPEFERSAQDAIKYLTQLMTRAGEITPSHDTPPAQKNHLRLAAVRLILKLCCHKRKCEEMISPRMFITVATTMINPPNPVRIGFVNQLKKYLGHNRLAHRWFTPFFLLAFEPDAGLQTSAVTWIRARVQSFARQQLQANGSGKKAPHTVMESVFARLLSLLAHHPDYPKRDSEDFDGDLLDFSKYIVFYLFTIATEDNLSLIFHIAQRVKGTKDGISGGGEEASERLYVLSDLAQAAIRNYADLMPAHAKGVNLLQTWPGSVTLPRSLFRALPSHEAAQEIAEKNFLPEDVAVGLEKTIRTYLKQLKSAGQPAKKGAAGERKRKSDATKFDLDDEAEDSRRPAKKPRRTSLAFRKTPKAKRKSSMSISPELPSRKSARVSTAVSYAEVDSDDEDADADPKRIGWAAHSPTALRRAKGRQGDDDEAMEDVGSDGSDVVADASEGHEPAREGDEADDGEVGDVAVEESEDEEDEAPSPAPKQTRSIHGKKEDRSKAGPSVATKASTSSKGSSKKPSAPSARPTRQSRRTKA